MRRLLFSIFVLSFLINFKASSEDRQYLLGDWNGTRTALEDSGISVESILTNDLVGNVSGGKRSTAGVLGNYDLTLAVDSEKAGMWSGGTLFVYFLGNYGRNPSTYVGDLQVSDNIETDDTFKLYEGWYEQALFDNRVRILFGLHDYNSEFDSLDYSGALLNSSFGISPDISQVGPSIFSTTSLAARVRLQLSDAWYLNSAVYDGVPGDPENSRGTHIKHPSSDGYFYAAELGLISPEEERHYKAAIGSWYHTAEFESVSSELEDKNHGFYAIGEYQVYAEEDPAQGLGIFVQTGSAAPHRNTVANYFGCGLSYQGLMPERDADTTSFGLALARSDKAYRRTVSDSDLVEIAVELTHRYEVTPYVVLQPDIQYIINPGLDPSLDDALVLGVRAEVRM